MEVPTSSQKAYYLLAKRSELGILAVINMSIKTVFKRCLNSI